MKINIQNLNKYSPNVQNSKKDTSLQNETSFGLLPKLQACRAKFLPVSFGGNASDIKKATIITNEQDIEIKKENNSYMVEKESQTSVIYGNDAKDFLANKTKFDYDTHVIFPKKARGFIEINGKKSKINENSAIVLGKGAEAKISVEGGYPMVLESKKDLSWYSRYSASSPEQKIRWKFEEINWVNSKLYNGEISKDSFDVSIADKLVKTGVAEVRHNDKLRFKQYLPTEIKKMELKEKGFSDKEIESILPKYDIIREVRLSAKISRKTGKNALSDETVKKLKDTNFLIKSRPFLPSDNNIYWKENYGNKDELVKCLQTKGFDNDSISKIVEAWGKNNKTGYDLSGLNLLSDNIAQYSLDKKVNTWTTEKTCWLTNSTEMVSQDGKAPSIGTSIVQAESKEPVSMNKIRSAEKLHVHPNDSDRKQSEVYLITSGCAALTIVKNGKAQVKILKEGEMAVISPGVQHCVNSIVGEYEQIVTQIPSAFQYGFEFKHEAEYPQGTSQTELEKEAAKELKKESQES